MKRVAKSMNVSEPEDYVSVSEAARMIQCSRSKVYRYIKEGRLSSERVSRTLRLRRNEVQHLQADLSENRRAKVPTRQQAHTPSEFASITIHVQIRPGKQEELEKRLAVAGTEQRYTFTGSVARYILEDDESIEMMLIWNKAEMPDATIWQFELQTFQQAFADVLDWESATFSFGNILRHI